MQTLTGKSVYNEIAFGKLYIYKRIQTEIKRYHIDNVHEEIKRFIDAKNLSVSQLGELYRKALLEIGENDAMIFYIHQMLLNDIDFTDSVQNIITAQKINAETAVSVTCSNISAMFSIMEDVYMRERSADIKDISERVIANLSHNNSKMQTFDEPIIIVADDLAPSETMQLDKSKITAFITENGASTSHTAILARTMNIPALIATKGILNEAYNGKDAIVDGFSGLVYIQPDKETKSKLMAEKQENKNKKHLLNHLKGKKSITKDGHEINLYANITSISDVENVIINDAQGIGLFRSEFIYMQNECYPDENMQFEIFSNILKLMDGKRVVIRTFDIGSDKKIEYFNIPPEDNPALGLRATRMYLKYPEIFKTHIRALLRASVYGKLALMIPMIISVDEVKCIKKIIENVKSELRNECIPFSEKIEFGIMIETPAAAIISDLLAPEVDFFSIGTNDLTQYTLALDRQNESVSELYNPSHQSVLRLIKLITDNAHKNGIWTSICGESAGNLSLTETFLSIGIDELSVTPSMVLPLREKILEINLSNTRQSILNELEM